MKSKILLLLSLLLFPFFQQVAFAMGETEPGRYHLIAKATEDHIDRVKTCRFLKPHLTWSTSENQPWYVACSTTQGGAADYCANIGVLARQDQTGKVWYKSADATKEISFYIAFNCYNDGGAGKK